jgi:hypothetical protein
MYRLLPATRRMTGLPLRPMLTTRNLWKRRNSKQVKVAETPGPKWGGGGHTGSFLPHVLSLNRSASSRQLRVASTSLMVELGNSNAVQPIQVGRENASVRTGGRRRRSSQMPRCNGVDTVKVRQGRPVKMEVNGCREERR